MIKLRKIWFVLSTLFFSAVVFSGAILEATQGNYAPIFVVLGLAYVAALLLIHVLVPRLEPIAVDLPTSA